MKRASTETTELPSRKRVRFSLYPEVINRGNSSNNKCNIVNEELPETDTHENFWYSKADLDFFRLAAMKVSVQVQEKYAKNLSDLNPMDTQHCDKFLSNPDETVRGLERLINPFLGIQRKQERQLVIRGVLFAQQLAKEMNNKNDTFSKEKNEFDLLIASFLQKETDKAKLIAHLVGKADQETASCISAH